MYNFFKKENYMSKIKEFQILVSCIVVCFSLLLCSLIFASKIQNAENITVTGSAYKIVKSDSAKLRISITAKTPAQSASYAKIKAQEPKVIKYLISKGIKQEDIEVKPISGYYNYRSLPSGGVNINDVVSYSADEVIEFKSNDVIKIKQISTDIQSLSSDSIGLDIREPEYYYSDLATIKIDLLKEATIDAKQRANSMLSATGSKVGRVKQVKMGVFQITPSDSTMVSDYGYNDTTSIDKKVTAVVNVVFKVR